MESIVKSQYYIFYIITNVPNNNTYDINIAGIIIFIMATENN